LIDKTFYAIIQETAARRTLFYGFFYLDIIVVTETMFAKTEHWVLHV